MTGRERKKMTGRENGGGGVGRLICHAISE